MLVCRNHQEIHHYTCLVGWLEGGENLVTFAVSWSFPKWWSPKGSCETAAYRKKNQNKLPRKAYLLRVSFIARKIMLQEVCKRFIDSLISKTSWQASLMYLFFCLYHFNIFLLFILPLKAHDNLAPCLSPPTVIKKTETVLRNIKFSCKIMKFQSNNLFITLVSPL